MTTHRRSNRNNAGPVEAYLRSDYEPDAEHVDGVIEERPTGVYDHGAWQRALLKWFCCPNKSCLWACRDLRLHGCAIVLISMAASLVEIWSVPHISLCGVGHPERKLKDALDPAA